MSSVGYWKISTWADGKWTRRTIESIERYPTPELALESAKETIAKGNCEVSKRRKAKATKALSETYNGFKETYA